MLKTEQVTLEDFYCIELNYMAGISVNNLPRFLSLFHISQVMCLLGF